MELTEKNNTSELQGTGNDTGDKTHVNNEKAILLNKTRRVSAKTAVKFRYAAIGVSWVSAVVSFLLGIGATVFAVVHDSQSLFGFGLDSLLDCASSVIILWRFHGRDTIYSEQREIRACILIGVLFVLSGLFLIVRCIIALSSEELPERPTVALILSSVMAFVCLVLGSSKVYLGYKLESRALITDSVITFTGAVMSVFTLIFSAVYKYTKSLWYLDDTFGIICSVFLICYGIRVIVVSKLELKQHKDTSS